MSIFFPVSSKTIFLCPLSNFAHLSDFYIILTGNVLDETTEESN